MGGKKKRKEKKEGSSCHTWTYCARVTLRWPQEAPQQETSPDEPITTQVCTQSIAGERVTIKVWLPHFCSNAAALSPAFAPYITPPPHSHPTPPPHKHTHTHQRPVSALPAAASHDGGRPLHFFLLINLSCTLFCYSTRVPTEFPPPRPSAPPPPYCSPLACSKHWAILERPLQRIALSNLKVISFN